MAEHRLPVPLNAPPPDRAGPEGSPGRFHKLAAFVYIVFCFEIGVFLLLFPWVDLWDQNFFSALSPGWRELWLNPYFRGAVSGIGIVNILISFSELMRLRRFARGQ